jgi:hypothetical protein
MPVLSNVSCELCQMSSYVVLLIDGLHELSYYKRHALDPLDLFLCPD